MIVEIVGWYGEDRQVRIFDLPDQLAESLSFFVSTGCADGELTSALDSLHTHNYDAIATVPISALDLYYRGRLAAMYVWETLSRFQVTPELQLEFSLR